MPLCAVATADARLSATTSMATRVREQHRDIATAVFWKRVGQPGTVTGGKRR
jgi:hypothetical protein